MDSWLSVQGKSHEGHQLLMAAIRACPSYAEAYNNLGVLQRDVGVVKVSCCSAAVAQQLSMYLS